MSSKNSTVLTILKKDAKFLYHKIESRKEEYLYVFSLQRSRSHYPELFSCKYEHATLLELKNIDPSTIVAIMDFYQQAESLKWYLMYTQDMPDKIADKLSYTIAQLRKLLVVLEMYVDVELGIIEPSNIEFNDDTQSNGP